MLAVDLHGALAGLLRLAVGLPVNATGPHAIATNSEGSAGADFQDIDIIDELVLVAGTGFLKYLPLSHADWVNLKSIAA